MTSLFSDAFSFVPIRCVHYTGLGQMATLWGRGSRGSRVGINLKRGQAHSPACKALTGKNPESLQRKLEVLNSTLFGEDKGLQVTEREALFSGFAPKEALPRSPMHCQDLGPPPLTTFQGIDKLRATKARALDTKESMEATTTASTGKAQHRPQTLAS